MFIGVVGLYFMPLNTLKWVSHDGGKLYDTILMSTAKFLSSSFLTLIDFKALFAYTLLAFAYACYFNWVEVQKTFTNCVSPFQNAVLPVYNLLSNPQMLSQYVVFALVVQANR